MSDDSWRNIPPDDAFLRRPDPLHERWKRACEDGTISDRLTLLRQILYRSDLRSARDEPTPVEIPHPLLPEDGDGTILLQRHGFSFQPTDRGFHVEARPWTSPSGRADSDDPSAAAVAEEYRRTFNSTPGDPVLKAWSETADTYLCPPQKRLLRATLEAPDGSTLLGVLPTASGKSLCAHLPALLKESSLTVVVVPTVALALDQEESIGIDVTAYRSGPDGNGSVIRDRIRSQDQRIVFTSPEAVLSSLSSPLRQAAEDGYLRHLVIDEAHIVDTWGDEFRPAFQELAGFRQMLLNLAPSPFQTLLLSATITRGSEATLRRLFGDPGPFKTCASVQLRPEPTYLLNQCESDEKRNEAVLDAIDHLPRPIILYVSKRAHVHDWYRRLQDSGYGRVAKMSGATPSSQRGSIIRQWRRREKDIIVATSAFGMGVDQQDVRTVIHACLPETIDRYYQEVGRSGRDGSASVAYLCTAPVDWGTADNLAEKRYIGVKKGMKRWRRMFESADRVEDLFTVSLKESFDTTMSGRKNVLWNQRTLLLMQRAGFINLLGPPSRDQFSKSSQSQNSVPANVEDEGVLSSGATEGSEDLYEDLRHHRLVNIATQRHLQEEKWESDLEPVRQQAYSYIEWSKELMRDVVDHEACISRILARAYAVGDTNVARTCNGCPHCRDQGLETRDTSMPMPPWPWPSPDTPPGLEGLGEFPAFTFYPQLEEMRDRIRLSGLLNGLVKRGVRHVIAPPATIENMDIRDGQQVYTSNEFDAFSAPDVPTLHVVPQGKMVPLDARKGMGPSVCVHVFPESSADPKDPERNLRRMIQGNVIPFDEVIKRLRT